MTKVALLERLSDLREQRVPFVLATVIRAESPTSAKPGDSAVILADGTIEGFVGGSCAEASVRVESLKALVANSPTTLVISPGDDNSSYVPRAGETSVENPCLSGGTLEIFLEPEIPEPRLVILGHAPIAQALYRMAPLAGFDVQWYEDLDEFPSDTEAVVLASHGSDEEPALRDALDSGVRYLALVASRKRGTAVLDSLQLDQETRARVRTPAGLEIGARTPAEVALAILAEIVATRPVEPKLETGREEGEVTSRASVAVDPVCGMKVAVSQASLQTLHEGVAYFFCGTGCKAAFTDNPKSYTT